MKRICSVNIEMAFKLDMAYLMDIGLAVVSVHQLQDLTCIRQPSLDCSLSCICIH